MESYDLQPTNADEKKCAGCGGKADTWTNDAWYCADCALKLIKK